MAINYGSVMQELRACSEEKAPKWGYWFTIYYYFSDFANFTLSIGNQVI